MPDPKRPIIVKKIKKSHGGHHGGSWKVAYADFVTAMMAFFLLMWLLAMVSPERKVALSSYFQDYSIFADPTSSTPPPSAPGINLNLESRPPPLKPSPAVEGAAKGGGPGEEELVKRLKGMVDEKLKLVKDQVIIDTVEGGVSIQIVDNEGGIMFLSGQPEPTARARDILKIVAESIRDLPNRIAVEGHTDGAPLRAGNMTNWELSTSRASAARRELEASNIPAGRIARVVGYADQELYIKHDPMDPRNRRITIILISPKQ
jgi:chemotaxis protein MotB